MILSKKIKLISTGINPQLIPLSENKYNMFIFNTECERYELEFKILTRCFKFNEKFAFDYVSQLDDDYYFLVYNGIMSILKEEPWN